MEYVEVDGSQGEGGGQILRSAAAFSVILKKPVRVSKIRAGREVPGLKRQHVSSIRVLSEVFGCEAAGVEEGSTQVTLVPGAARLERMSIDMGTAASITLVLQAVIPAASLSGSRLTLELVGGTDVPWSPTFDYMDTVVSEAFSAIGIGFRARALRRGYYPRGGGRVEVEIQPCRSLTPLDMPEPSLPLPVRLVSRCGRLPRSVAERQADEATRVLRGGGLAVENTAVAEEDSDSPGSSVLVHQLGRGAFVGSDALGARGVRAEEVGAKAAEALLGYSRAGARVDPNLADMVAPLLSLAKGPSRFRTSMASKHLGSSLALAKQFTGCSYGIDSDGRGVLVTISPP